MDLILYHNNCPDGWCAAYICHKRYPEAELIPLNHGLTLKQMDKLMTDCYDKDVLMVDYSLPTRLDNDMLKLMAKSFRILDHHKTAQAALEDAPYATFDMKRSGAGLAWDYLFGENAPWRPGEWNSLLPSVSNPCAFTLARPWWVDYTEDQDLWNWAIPKSQQVNAFLMTRPRTVEEWDCLTQLDPGDVENLGEGVRQYIEYYTRCVLEFVSPGILGGCAVGVLNIPYVGVSESCNAVVKLGYDIGLAWFERNDGQIQFSLRSNKDGSNVDVSAIAKEYGGGGHRNASGFQLPLAEGHALIGRILGRKENRSSGVCIQ